LIQSFTYPEGANLFYGLDKIVGRIDKDVCLSTGHELDPEPVRVEPYVFHDPLKKEDHVQCVVIAVGDVVAFV